MLKVGVLMGGMSIEREVSFNSGRTICDHLDSELFSVVPLFLDACGKLYILPWSFLYRGKIIDFQHRLVGEAQEVVWDNLSNHVDFVYVALHGKYGEDGRLQAMLELMKIPYLGSKLFGSSLGMNKIIHNDFLRAHGIDVPKGFSLSVREVKKYDAEVVEQKIKKFKISFPVIVKPNNEGSSFGVFVVNKQEDLERLIKKSCFISGEKGQPVLVEEKIEGMEFTCILITDNETNEIIALPPTEVLVAGESQIFDYEQKYMPGAVNEQTPARCSDEQLAKIKQVSIDAMKALNFTNMARIDGFLTNDNKVVIIDSNPLSGMGPATFLFRQAAEVNISHTKLINHLIKTELRQYDMEKKSYTDQKKNKKRLRVGVLLGGPSNEREISLESGRNVVYKMSPQKYEAIPIFMGMNNDLYILDDRMLVHSSTREIMSNIADARKILWSDLPKLVDFVFIGLHGAPGEDGTVQGALEMLKIPYNGSGIFASNLCMDKYKTGQFLSKKGFHLPQAVLIEKSSWHESKQQLDSFIDKVGFPCFVKPHNDGCSVGVACVKNKKQLEDAIESVLKFKDCVLVEEKVTGMELTVGVVGNEDVRSLVPSQAVAKGDLLSLEEKFLPGAGENQTPALLAKKDIIFVQHELENVYKAIGCKGYVRIDCFFQNKEQSQDGKQRLVIIEINSLPAMTPATCIFHQAAEEGLRPMDLIDEIIQLGLQEHQHSDVVSVDTALQVQQEL